MQDQDQAVLTGQGWPRAGQEPGVAPRQHTHSDLCCCPDTRTRQVQFPTQPPPHASASPPGKWGPAWVLGALRWLLAKGQMAPGAVSHVPAKVSCAPLLNIDGGYLVLPQSLPWGDRGGCRCPNPSGGEFGVGLEGGGQDKCLQKPGKFLARTSKAQATRGKHAYVSWTPSNLPLFFHK